MWLPRKSRRKSFHRWRSRLVKLRVQGILSLIEGLELNPSLAYLRFKLGILLNLLKLAFEFRIRAHHKSHRITGNPGFQNIEIERDIQRDLVRKRDT